MKNYSDTVKRRREYKKEFMEKQAIIYFRKKISFVIDKI